MDEDLFGLFGMAWLLGWAVLVVVVWHLRATRRQNRWELIHKERLAAMDKGIPLPELPDYGDSTAESALTEALGFVRLNPRWPLGVGAICIMLGAGTCVALRLSGDAYHNEVWPFGLVGVFLGVGLWLHYLLTRPRSR
jgi:hypothetical protein